MAEAKDRFWLLVIFVIHRIITIQVSWIIKVVALVLIAITIITCKVYQAVVISGVILLIVWLIYRFNESKDSYRLDYLLNL